MPFTSGSESEIELDLGKSQKRLNGKKSHLALRSCGRLIRLDRQRFLCQQGALKVCTVPERASVDAALRIR
jgi:hypothetical protein